MPRVNGNTAGAVVHTTSCGRYVVSFDADGSDNVTCISMRQAKDVLRRRGVKEASFAQRVVFDEMIGQPEDEAVTLVPIRVI